MLILKKYTKFCVVGGSGALLQLAVVWTLTEALSLHYMYSLGVAIVLVSAWNFTWNHQWTFNGK